MLGAPVAGSRGPEGTWRRFRSLGLVLLLLVASQTPATAQSIAHMQRKASAARARRQAQLTKREEWEKLRKQAPRRETVETCVGRACSIRGLMASLSEGHGLVFCRDCPDPHVQGSWSTSSGPMGEGARSPGRKRRGVGAVTARLLDSRALDRALRAVDTWEAVVHPHAFQVSGGMHALDA